MTSFSASPETLVSDGVFGRLEKSPNRDWDFAGLGMMGLGSLLCGTRFGVVCIDDSFCRGIICGCARGTEMVAEGIEGSFVLGFVTFEVLEGERSKGFDAVRDFWDTDAINVAFSIDSRRVWPVVMRRLRLLWTIGEGFLYSSSIGVPSRLGRAGGPLIRYCASVASLCFNGRAILDGPGFGSIG